MRPTEQGTPKAECLSIRPRDVLSDLLRQGAQEMLAAAIENGVAEYIERHAALRDDEGRRLVVRNGRLPARQILTGPGLVEVQPLRVNDRRINELGGRMRFSSTILPPYRGDGLLYRRGFLKVSENHRYLVHDDGTPFLWMGDTAWAVPQRATDEDWAACITDRIAKHFTVIQVAPAPAWAGPSDRRGERPFTDKWCSRWNPAYWQSFEQKVQRANEAGLVVLLVGLMEPVQRYPETDKACLFARNIVARLFGNFVIFSPSFDRDFMPLANEVGRAAREATAVHLITQHPGTPWNQPTPTVSDKYCDESYLDIAAVQTGHKAGHRDWCAHHAIEWVLHLCRHEPHKPIINLEVIEIDVSAFPAPLKVAGSIRCLGIYRDRRPQREQGRKSPLPAGEGRLGFSFAADGEVSEKRRRLL